MTLFSVLMPCDGAICAYVFFAAISGVMSGTPAACQPFWKQPASTICFARWNSVCHSGDVANETLPAAFFWIQFGSLEKTNAAPMLFWTASAVTWPGNANRVAPVALTLPQREISSLNVFGTVQPCFLNSVMSTFMPDAILNSGSA